MSTELVPFVEGQVSTSISEMCVATKGFLPRVQLYGGSSSAVKEEKIPMGHWGVVRGQDIDGLGKSFNCLIMAVRPFAMNYRDETPVVSYDPKSEIFKDIAAKASEGMGSKCMAGPQFLLWISDIQEYVTLFCNNATFQREAPVMEKLLRKRAKFTATLIKGAKHTWHGPKVTPCEEEFDIPPQEELRQRVIDFMNPKEDEVLPADAEAQRDR